MHTFLIIIHHPQMPFMITIIFYTWLTKVCDSSKCRYFWWKEGFTCYMRQVKGRDRDNISHHGVYGCGEWPETAFDFFVNRGLPFSDTLYNPTVCGTFHTQHHSLGYTADKPTVLKKYHKKVVAMGITCPPS